MTPPRVPRWLLERTLPPEDRGVILGDLAEEFETRKGEGAWAGWWYCRQAIRAIPGGIWRRRPRFRNIVNDLRFTCRLWKRHPAFAAAAISTQAIGIAVTTAVLVVAQSVADRTREIGVRVALGASRAGIVRLVMRRALAAAGTGAALGVLGTLAASKWLSALLFGVSPRDPMTIAAATVLLGAVALAACVIPTRRALNVDPASAVRE